MEFWSALEFSSQTCTRRDMIVTAVSSPADETKREQRKAQAPTRS